MLTINASPPTVPFKGGLGLSTAVDKRNAVIVAARIKYKDINLMDVCFRNTAKKHATGFAIAVSVATK